MDLNLSGTKAENDKNDNNRAKLLSVLNKYAPLVKSRAVYFSSISGELDDLIQEGNIGLFAAVHKYDGSKASFYTFAKRCIDSSIIDYLRRTMKVSDIGNKMPVDIDGIEIADTSPDVAYAYDVKEEYSAVVKKAESVLSGLEAEVFRDLINGYSNMETASRLNVDIKVVRNAVQRIRCKLK